MLIAVVTTVGSLDEARRMARDIVSRRLAACAHVDGIESFYAWKGAMQHDQEFRVWFKTTSERYDAVENAIRELHSYELPAVYAMALERVHAPYAAWVAQSTS